MSVSYECQVPVFTWNYGAVAPIRGPGRTDMHFTWNYGTGRVIEGL